MKKITNGAKKGITLIELMIALVILSLIGTALVSNMQTGIDVWETENTHTELLQNAVTGLDKMTRELKQATQIVSVINPISGKNDYIRFKDANKTDKVFQFNNNYLEFGNAVTTERLAGPITKLEFKYFGYANDGTGKTILKDLGTNPEDKDKIRLIRIDMEAKEAGSGISLPVSSQVAVLTESLSDDDSGEEKDKIKLQNYALFGFNGFQIKNNLWIGSYPEPNNPPANVGSFAPGMIFNNLTLYGSVFAKGDIDLSNNDAIYGDVFSGGNVTVNKTTITGSLNYAYPGTLSPENYTAGGGNQVHEVLDEYFWNTLPKPYPFTPGTGTQKINNKEVFAPNPGTYGDIEGKGGTLQLSNGEYYFNNVTGQMTIDIKNISSGIRIFIAGNFDDKGNGINMTIDGSPIDINNPSHREIASLIYIEVQGNISITPNNILAGTIYASDPNEGNIVFKSSLTVVGALYGMGVVGDTKIPNNSLTIYYIPADENNLPETWK